MYRISKCIILCVLGLYTVDFEAREFGQSFDERVTFLEKRVDKVITKNETLKTEVLETTTARPDQTEKQWFLNFDILYWHAKVGGTSFAYSNERASIDLPIQGYTKRIPFNWDFGFKVGIGKHFEHDKWSSSLTFTYFKSADDASMKGSPLNSITPLKGPFSHSVKKAKSEYYFGYYNLDLDLYRHYFISHGVSLKPSVGLKNTWLDLNQVVRYSGGDILQGNTAHTRSVSDMWAIGPKAGFDSNWYLGNGFEVFGLFTASLIYGYFQVSEESKVTPSSSQDFSIRDRFHRFVPNVGFYLGLGYGSYFYDNKCFIDLKLGYECQYFWRANQSLRLQTFNNSYRYDNLSEDLSIHGVTFKLGIAF